MRKRYKYVAELDAVVDVLELAQAKHIQTIFVLPDLNTAYNGGFVSPIDDTYISSRSQLREHNKRHGVEQNGDIRGERAREMNRKFMDYDPSLIGRSETFKWKEPTTCTGNLTEV